eukprot:tig00001128_g7177.t1
MRGEELDPTKITSYHPKHTPPDVARALGERLGFAYLDGVLSLQIKSVELYGAQGERSSLGSDKKTSSKRHGGVFKFFRRRRSSLGPLPGLRERRCRITVESPRFDYQSPHYALDSSGRAGSFTDSVEIAVSPSDLPVVLVTAFEAGPDGSEKKLGCASLRFDVMAIEGRIAEAFFPLGALPLGSDAPPVGRVECRLAFSGRPVARETAELAAIALEAVPDSARSSSHSHSRSHSHASARPSPAPAAPPPPPLLSARPSSSASGYATPTGSSSGRRATPVASAAAGEMFEGAHHVYM